MPILHRTRVRALPSWPRAGRLRPRRRLLHRVRARCPTPHMLGGTAATVGRNRRSRWTRGRCRSRGGVRVSVCVACSVVRTRGPRVSRRVVAQGSAGGLIVTVRALRMPRHTDGSHFIAVSPHHLSPNTCSISAFVDGRSPSHPDPLAVIPRVSDHGMNLSVERADGWSISEDLCGCIS